MNLYTHALVDAMNRGEKIPSPPKVSIYSLKHCRKWSPCLPYRLHQETFK
jgi:hypothetical protein